MLDYGQPLFRFHLANQIDEFAEQVIDPANDEPRQSLRSAAVLQQAAVFEGRLLDLLHRRLQLALEGRDGAVVPPREGLAHKQGGQGVHELLVRLVIHLHDLQHARGRGRGAHPLHEALRKTARPLPGHPAQALSAFPIPQSYGASNRGACLLRVGAGDIHQLLPG